jgi:2-keto-3-deoxy-L-rhamnonate aldolase RhmA/quercetin dioxygenase-like cupin family protein
MKTNALKKLRAKLAADQPVYGLWVTLESASISEMAVALGLDWVVIDAEHGHLDWKEILEHIRATVRSETVALVRVAESNGGLIKRALDIGADGVVVPWIESAEALRQATSYALYPPQGVRGIGAERATAWGQCFAEHAAEANENVLIVPIVETVRGGRDIEALCAVDGVDVLFVGPADYSATAGFRGQWEGPGVAEQLLSIKETIRRAGKHCGIMATGNDNLLERRGQGFRMLGFGTDAGLLLRSLHDSLNAAGRDRRIQPDLSVGPAPSPAAPLACPPAGMRPDRPEVMNPLGSGPKVELAPGVSFECLVGAHNRARKLTTGLVTFQPGAELPYHSHPFSESITLMAGEASMEVAGRRYRLGPLDNVTIPAGLAHRALNTSGSTPTIFHIALASDTPTRTLVDKATTSRDMPNDSTGQPGAERVTRFATAARFAAGPNTAFIDFFNRDLIPGIEMSGGYGLFEPGGRLPAHVHDFDESICIIDGVATCVVEGRRYSMTDCATALQPRGRVHYFINDSPHAMAMIWVYAGPTPERIVVDERCATEAGNPWK